MYLIYNTKIAVIENFMTKHGVVVLIMDIVSANYDVNSQKKTCFFATLYQKVTKKQTKKLFQKHIDPIYVTPDQSFHIKKKPCSIQFNLDRISKSSFLTLDFLDWLIVQYTLDTLYTAHKKTLFPKRIDPLCMETVQGFYNLTNLLE